MSLPSWALRPAFGLAAALVGFGGLTALLAPLLEEDEITAVAMLFLLVVLLASATWGYRVGLFSAVIADLALNVFFVPPLHTATVREPRHVVALVVFLAVAGVGASMFARLQRQLAIARDRRAELTIMLGISRELAAAPTPRRALDALCWAVVRSLGAKRCDILRPEGKTWNMLASTGDVLPLTKDDAALAAAALESGEIVRRMAEGVRRTRATVRLVQRDQVETYVPFRSSSASGGVLRIVGQPGTSAVTDLDALLRAFADEADVAIHRATLAEQAREAAALQASDEFKSALLSSVSHDLRSPLTAIKAAVGSLRTDTIAWSDEDRAHLLEAIESQTDRLTATVTDLLDMSRLEGGAVRPAMEDFDVRTLLQDAVMATRAATAGREVGVDAGEAHYVHADYGLILQAMTNLIENAAAYSTPGGAIRLGVRPSPGRVTIDVSDSGPGISPADLPRVFERFCRGAEGKKVPGTGLGLAIVRAMVELNGGTVSVESSPSGSTFRLSLLATRAPR